MVVAYTEEASPGWAPVSHMAMLAASLFESRYIAVPTSGTLRKAQCALKAMVGVRRVMEGRPDLLLIVHSPSQLRLFTGIPGWRNSFNRCVVWIVDSFWTDRIRNEASPRLFQHLFIMYGSDLSEYRLRTGIETSFLGWGTDALRISGLSEVRDIDVLRVGRQPPSWSDDGDNLKCLSAVGIRYQGRPPLHNDHATQNDELMRFYRRSRIALAFSNLSSPASYTHPTKEYLTARWMDALAAGCVVAGMAPSSDLAFKNYLWPGATVELGTTERDGGLQKLRESVSGWGERCALTNQIEALRRLDWRWRFKEIADYLGKRFEKLESEIARLESKIVELKASL